MNRKAAIAAYKEQKPDVGIFAIRCAASGQVWVGATTSLDKRWNRLSFVLRVGSGSTPAIHAAHARYGADTISYEILERFTKDDSEAEFQDAWLKTRLAHWQTGLSAGIAR
jgi:hypothetical protein